MKEGNDFEICWVCRGSGEGSADGTLCSQCKGTGELATEHFSEKTGKDMGKDTNGLKTLLRWIK